jgi:hypothetical protein
VTILLLQRRHGDSGGNVAAMRLETAKAMTSADMIQQCSAQPHPVRQPLSLAPFLFVDNPQCA